MMNFTTRAEALLICALSVGLSVSDVLAQEKGGTKFRGISVNQSKDVVKKATQALGFVVRDEGDYWAIDRQDRVKCAYVRFENERVNVLDLQPCYFNLDSEVGAAELAQQIANNYRVPRFTPRTRDDVDMLSYPPGRLTISYYYGQLPTGETVEIVAGSVPRAIQISTSVKVIRTSKRPKPTFN